MDTAAYPAPLEVAVMDGLRHPVFVVDANRVLHLRNRRAADMLARADCLAESGDRLHGATAGIDAALQGALLRLSDSTLERWIVQLETKAAGNRVVGNVSRLGWLAGCHPLAVIAVFMPHALECDAETLAAMFGFTPAEGRVAAHIAQGWSPKQIALECEVSTSTVRSQVRSLFEKTGVRRQPDLVRLLLLATAL